MRKKDEKLMKTQPEVKRAIKALKIAQAKREKRYADTRVVYAYLNPSNGKCTDNLILLPADTVDAHEDYLRNAISHLLNDASDERIKAVSKIRIMRIGTFRVDTLEFRKLQKPIKLFTFGDVVKGMKR